MAFLPHIKDEVAVAHPLDEAIEYKTLISQFDSGAESRKQKYLFPRRNYKLGYNYISKEKALILWQFYLDRKGRFEAFYLLLPWYNTYVKEYVGTGDDLTVTFSAPSKLAASYDVYLEGVVQTITTDYSVDSSGEESTNRIVFVVAPTLGEKITFSFTGYLKIRVRFSEDIFNFQTFYDRLVTANVRLKGLLHG